MIRLSPALAMLALGVLAGSACGSAEPSANGIVRPPDGRWQYQLQASPAGNHASGGIDVDICERPFVGGPACVTPSVIDFDLYRDQRGPGIDDRPNRRAVAALHRLGGYAICYVDAGGIEDHRPDYHRFLRWHRRHGRSLLGDPFSKRFPDERWANVGGARQRAFLLRMMERRVAKCERAGFDAVEFDVVDAWDAGRRRTGWRVSYRDQLKYNRSLAAIAHEHGLAVGLKNDLGQIEDLVDRFDFAINEECVTHDECELLRPFVEAGKPVFHVEYEQPRSEFCEAVAPLGFNSIRKRYELFARPYLPCS
jgi:Glycoside-hydrolase family GH114